MTLDSDDLTIRGPALDYVKENKDSFLKRLCALIRVPSVGPWQTQAPEVLQSITPYFCFIFFLQLTRAAESISGELRTAGLKNVQLLSVANAPPYVYGEWLDCGATKLTVLLYAHYDVQGRHVNFPFPNTFWHHAFCIV